MQEELALACDQNHLLQLELDKLKDKAAEEEAGHKLARQANAALIGFIHTRHRLSVPFDPQSIRGILQKADQ